jgi:hypothetical protein
VNKEGQKLIIIMEKGAIVGLLILYSALLIKNPGSVANVYSNICLNFLGGFKALF